MYHSRSMPGLVRRAPITSGRWTFQRNLPCLVGWKIFWPVQLPVENSEKQAEPVTLDDSSPDLESKIDRPDNVDPLFPKPPRIPPLYTSPPLEAEGIWTSDEMPQASDGRPLMYKTVYRPSVDFPNSIVYMALFDISRLKTRLFIGNTEPGMYEISYMPERESLSKIVAITNALWMQQHARGAGAIFRGRGGLSYGPWYGYTRDLSR